MREECGARVWCQTDQSEPREKGPATAGEPSELPRHLY